VVMVVADPQLVARGGAGQVDPAYQTGAAEHPQHVIDGLHRDPAELAPDCPHHRVDRAVRCCREGAEDGEPGLGDSQPAARSRAACSSGAVGVGADVGWVVIAVDPIPRLERVKSG
jgi:hypothetical protein